MTDTYWGLFAGYSAVWLVFGFYLLSLHKKLTTLENKLSEDVIDED